MATDDTLAHFGVAGMKWGQRKTPEETFDAERKKEQKTGRIMGGSIGALGALTAVSLLAKEEPKPKRLKGRAFIASLFKKKPPTVVPNPQKLNTANMAFRALTKSKYGKAVVALGGFAVAASIGGKLATKSFDNDQLDPTRLVARQANAQNNQASAEAIKAGLHDATQSYIDKH